MKTAQTAQGQSVVASQVAPRQAICPTCGDVVVLRHRQRMGKGGTSYFWRHLRNRSRRCASRVYPFLLR